MSNRVVAVIVLSIVCALSAAAEEKKAPVKWKKVPDGFRGVRFGATKEEAEAVLGRMRCTNVAAVKPHRTLARPVSRPGNTPGYTPSPAFVAPPKPVAPAHMLCTTTDKARAFTANGKVVRTEYLFDENRFVAVELSRIETMRPSQVLMYADIRPLFDAEYGEPTRSSTNRIKGTKHTTVSTWDVKQNKSVTRTVPQHYDYEATCAEWKDERVEIDLCAQDTVFSSGSIRTAAWIKKTAEWSAQPAV